MAIVIPNGFAQIVLTIRRTGDPDPYNVIYGVDAGTAPLLGDVATACFQAFADHLTDQMTNVQVLEQVVAQDEQSAGTALGAAQGTVSAATLPPNCAVLLRKFTGLRGRHQRGRNYWPGFVAEQGVNDLGEIDDDDLAPLTSAFGDWLDAHIDAGYPLVLLHNDTAPVTTPTPITGIRVEKLIATQRRRLR